MLHDGDSEHFCSSHALFALSYSSLAITVFWQVVENTLNEVYSAKIQREVRV